MQVCFNSSTASILVNKYILDSTRSLHTSSHDFDPYIYYKLELGFYFIISPNSFNDWIAANNLYSARFISRATPFNNYYASK